MMWDEVLERAFELIQNDSVLTEIFGPAMRMAGSGAQQVPGLEYHLIGDTEGELWAPMIVQFDVWSEDMTVVTRAERRLRVMFHKDLPSTLGGLTMWMQFTDGQVLASPERSGFNGRAIRFTLTPLRRQYALRESVP